MTIILSGTTTTILQMITSKKHGFTSYVSKMVATPTLVEKIVDAMLSTNGFCNNDKLAKDTHHYTAACYAMYNLVRIPSTGKLLIKHSK